jgi:hypothetical protein
MFRLMGALLDVCSRRVGKLRIPNQVLSAVQVTPVPVGPHHGADEVGVILVGSVVFDKMAALDLVGGSSNCSSRHKSD